MSDQVNTYREKVWFHDNTGEKVWCKTYLRIVVAETETNVWTYDDEKIALEVYKDGSLHIEDDRQWVSVMNLKGLELLKEAVEVAIQTKKNL